MISPFVTTLLAAATTAAGPVATSLPVGALPGAKGAVPNPGATLNPEVLKQLQAFQFAHKTGLAANAPWLTHTFAGLFVVLAIALVALLAVQTTKQEGLSGTIGGRVESNYRPRLGFDQQLARLTSFVALSMVFFAVVLSITGI